MIITEPVDETVEVSERRRDTVFDEQVDLAEEVSHLDSEVPQETVTVTESELLEDEKPEDEREAQYEASDEREAQVSEQDRQDSLSANDEPESDQFMSHSQGECGF